MAEYRVLVYEADTSNSFGVGDCIGEFTHAKNLGYAQYLNDIGEAFWTINQADSLATSTMRGHFGTAHVKILRNSQTVWRGVLAELDANNEDVIMYAYGYEHILYHLLSKWNQTFKSQRIAGAAGRPVNKLWTRATTTLANSQLGFASTGTLQAPVTTSGGATPIEMESYKLYYRRMLHAFKELVAIAVSDTTNICYFELDYTNSPTSDTLTFNFWKDNTEDTDLLLKYPNNVSNFSDRYVPIFTRNDIKGVGTGARDQLFRSSQITSGGTFGHAAFGRRQEPIYLSWVRDESELDRVTKLRAKKALREDVNLYLRLWPDAGFLPFRATGSGHELGDRIQVEIDRGITQIDKLMLLVGEQVVYVNGAEYVQPILEDRSG